LTYLPQTNAATSVFNLDSFEAQEIKISQVTNAAAAHSDPGGKMVIYVVRLVWKLQSYLTMMRAEMNIRKEYQHLRHYVDVFC